MQTIDVPPRPSSLMESLRDIGYSMGTALADLLDNCVTAQASTIRIFVDTDDVEPRVGILDDGIGMTETDLIEAMRFGTRSPLEERGRHDLGRFGLGLKTASLSQCRAVTVVTRSGGVTAGARWDLDYIAESDEWRVQIPDDLQSVPWFEELGDSGTLVVLEKLDPTGDEQEASRGGMDLVRRADEARRHLELVFHRFLAGEPGQRRVRILMNERPLDPYDPFHAGHPATMAGPTEKIRVNHHDIIVQPFTLPHHAKVTSAEWERHAGVEGYVQNQGFYVYRERRLIIHGTWFGLARKTELTKLARVRVDIPNGLDAVWKLDIKKASAQIPPTVRERLGRIIEPLTSASKRVYTGRGRRLVDENRIPVWIRVQDKNAIIYRVNPEHPVLAEFQSRLSPDMRGIFLKVIEITGASLPMDALFADLGGEPDRVANSATLDALRYAAETTYAHLMNGQRSSMDARAMMRVAEPFRSNWNLTEQLLDEYGAKRH